MGLRTGSHGSTTYYIQTIIFNTWARRWAGRNGAAVYLTTCGWHKLNAGPPGFRTSSPRQHIGQVGRTPYTAYLVHGIPVGQNIFRHLHALQMARPTDVLHHPACVAAAEKAARHCQAAGLSWATLAASSNTPRAPAATHAYGNTMHLTRWRAPPTAH